KRRGRSFRQAGLLQRGFVLQLRQAVVDFDQFLVTEQIAAHVYLPVMFERRRPVALLPVVKSVYADNLVSVPGCAAKAFSLGALPRKRLLIEKMMQVHPEAAMKIKNILIGLHTRLDSLWLSIILNGGLSLSENPPRASNDRHQRAQRRRHTITLV